MDIKQANILHIILLVIIGIIPLLIRATPYSFISPAIEPTPMKTAIYIDPFNQIKFQWLLGLCILLVISFFIILYLNKIKVGFYDYLIATFIILALAASYLSKYKFIGLWGKYNRTDGAIFFILVFFLTFLASKLTYSDKMMDIFAWAMWPFLLINSLLAYMYQNGINFLDSQFFKKIVCPDVDYQVRGFIMATFENPNYLSGFGGFLAIFFLTRFIFIKKINIFDAFAFILSLFLLLSSFSSSGIVAFIICSLILFLFVNKTNITAVLKFFFGLPFAFFFTKYFTGKDPRIAAEFKNLSKLLEKHFISIILIILGIFLLLFFLKKIVNYKKWRKTISAINIIFVFAFFLFFPFSEYYQKDYPHHLYESDEIINFVENKQTKTDDLSGRVFIWRETIDLIKERPFLGYGYASLVYELNSYSIFDPATKWPSNDIFDKPHNSYLEIAYGGGLLSLAAFMLLFVNLFFQGLENLRENFDPRNLSVFMAMLAFLIQALINDSNVGSYPVMFIFFGILISRLNNNEIEMEVPRDGKKKFGNK